jgi:hypothetical protein
MPDIIIAKPGQVVGGSDALQMFLKVFGGETITAFERSSVTFGRHMVRTIAAGKSAQFPVFGRTNAHYLKPGKSLDDLRENIPHNERNISIDGLLTADCLISDIEEAMAHYDISGEYSRQLGEALAIAADGAVLAEAAKMVVEDKENIPGLGKGKLVTRNIAASDYGITEAMGKAIVSMLLEIKAAMSKNRVPATERYVYMKPEGTNALVASLVAINRDFGAVASITEANVLRVAGFDIIETPHLTDGGAAVNDGVLQGNGHVFPATYAESCQFIAMHRTAVGTVKLRDLALEQARRPEYQADQIIAKYAMGHGGLRPEAAFMGVMTHA